MSSHNFAKLYFKCAAAVAAPITVANIVSGFIPNNKYCGSYAFEYYNENISPIVNLPLITFPIISNVTISVFKGCYYGILFPILPYDIYFEISKGEKGHPLKYINVSYITSEYFKNNNWSD